MDILDDMGVSKLSAKLFSKVNHSFNMTSVNTLLLNRTTGHCLTLKISYGAPQNVTRPDLRLFFNMVSLKHTCAHKCGLNLLGEIEFSP